MRRWSVIVELTALQDISAAYQWLADQAPEAAERWYDGLYDTIGSLEVFPERCPLAPESKSFKVPIRELFHGRRQFKYRILFTVRENEVRVLHVRHGARLPLGENDSSKD